MTSSGLVTMAMRKTLIDATNQPSAAPAQTSADKVSALTTRRCSATSDNTESISAKSIPKLRHFY